MSDDDEKAAILVAASAVSAAIKIVRFSGHDPSRMYLLWNRTLRAAQLLARAEQLGNRVAVERALREVASMFTRQPARQERHAPPLQPEA
jgi:hypothetical protein